MAKVIDIVIPILKNGPLTYEDLILEVNKILTDKNEQLGKEKLKKSITKLVDKRIYRWRNGYLSIKKSPDTEDLEKLKSIPNLDNTFCQTYLEDLETLESWNDSVDEKIMRQMSPIVRRILVENDLQKLWKHLSFHGQLKLDTPYLDNFLEKMSPAQITFLSAGGTKNNGMQIGNVMLFNSALSEEEIKFLNKNSKPERAELSLNDFMDSACLIVEGEIISRREVIKYIANKLGGNHFDPSRNATRAEDESLVEKYKKLDKISKINLANLKAVYFELLSIVQCLFISEDVKKMISKMKEITAEK